ncbi:hypothetical protein FB639_003370, partial [Coemansia asiatica]
NLIALEDEMGALKEKGVAVKQRLEDCDMLLQMLIECNKDQREADCLQINGLINNVEDLSNVKTAMMDYARTAMIRSHKLEDFLDDSFMGDLQPLMSQLAAEFSASNAPQQQVMVGESPRIIRTPRRRGSSFKKPSLKPGKQTQQPLSADGFSKVPSINSNHNSDLNADTGAKGSPAIKQKNLGFVGVPSAEFTFSSP